MMLLADSEAAFWAWGAVLGIFVGPVQAASRSYLSRLAPEHLRTQFFGLYALSGKATAFAGPLLVGWITATSGSQRLGMSTIIVLFAAGLALVLTLPRADGSGKPG
jgi:UMF1 family MFS transporter